MYLPRYFFSPFWKGREGKTQRYISASSEKGLCRDWRLIILFHYYYYLYFTECNWERIRQELVTPDIISYRKENPENSNKKKKTLNSWYRNKSSENNNKNKSSENSKTTVTFWYRRKVLKIRKCILDIKSLRRTTGNNLL